MTQSAEVNGTVLTFILKIIHVGYDLILCACNAVNCDNKFWMVPFTSGCSHDQPQWFPPNWPPLIICDPEHGISAQDVQMQIRAFLQPMSGGT
jgi:hypothetical protein